MISILCIFIFLCSNWSESLFPMSVFLPRLGMFSFLGTMHIDSLFRMQRDLRLRGLHHSFLLIKPLFKIHLMCLTSGSTQPHSLLFIFSARKWMVIAFTRLAVYLLLLCSGCFMLSPWKKVPLHLEHNESLSEVNFWY